MSSRTRALVGLGLATFLWPAVAWAGPPERAQIYVPIALFICLAITVGFVKLAQHRNLAERHETLRAMVDKGMEIPPRLLAEAPRPANPRRDLRRGILLLSAGVGIFLFLLIDEGGDDAALGFVPAFIGIGYLIVAKLERQWPTPPPAETDSTF